MDLPRSDAIESPQDELFPRLDPGRSRTPYVLHLPRLPTPGLDVAPEAREGETRSEPEASRGTGPLWYNETQEPAERREQPTHPPPENYMFSHFELGPRNPSTFSQYAPPPRPSLPQSSPPVAVLPPTNTFAWVPQNHRAPVGDAYNRRPHVNLTRHLTLPHRREPPPLLPQPDFGHAFVTEGQDRDTEMGAASQPQGQTPALYNTYSGTTSPSAMFTYLQQPRSHREEDIQTQSPVWYSTQPPSQSRPPPQFQQRPPLLGDPPIARQRQVYQLIHNPPEVARRPRPPPTENRRVLRFALPQAEEAAGFSTSSSSIRIPERMPSLDTENQTSSPIQSSHRTVEPRYLSGPLTVDIVDRRRDSLPAHSSTTLDPAAFAPGPFRNTIHQTFYPRMNHPTPPTIPPLPFQHPAPGSQSQSGAIPVPPPSEETYPPRGRDEPAEFGYSIRVRRPAQNTEQYPPQTSSRPFAANHNDDDEVAGARRRMPSTNQEARLDSSRIADLLSLEAGNGPSISGNHRRYSLPPRSDAMRSTPTVIPRHQLLNLFHHHAEGERRRGGAEAHEMPHTEGPPANGARPASNLPPRRFGPVELEHFQSWRTRARGRFRITPEFLATRLRPGNMGDFIVSLLHATLFLRNLQLNSGTSTTMISMIRMRIWSIWLWPLVMSNPSQHPLIFSRS
jgi:hypothetical protein